jgi:transposase-like protein
VSQDVRIGGWRDVRWVSKARLVITAAVVEGRGQSAVARQHGISQGWVSRLAKRHRLQGEAAFEPRSRRAHTASPGCRSRPLI